MNCYSLMTCKHPSGCELVGRCIARQVLNPAEIIQLRTELEQPDRGMFVIAYALAAGVWAIGFATGALVNRARAGLGRFAASIPYRGERR